MIAAIVAGGGNPGLPFGCFLDLIRQRLEPVPRGTISANLNGVHDRP
jgi:hypothetical protein